MVVCMYVSLKSFQITIHTDQTQLYVHISEFLKRYSVHRDRAERSGCGIFETMSVIVSRITDPYHTRIIAISCDRPLWMSGIRLIASTCRGPSRAQTH
jgi:hypothetical protein